MSLTICNVHLVVLNEMSSMSVVTQGPLMSDVGLQLIVCVVELNDTASSRHPRIFKNTG